MTTKPPLYVVVEGGEGTYKTSTIAAVADRLTNHGYRVLVTSEPGTPHLPVTMELRKIMLDNKYDAYLPPYAREFISQAIRQIHLEKLIRPAYNSGLYDVILQDRGIMSGIIYAEACGVDATDFTPEGLLQTGIADAFRIYDLTIVLNREKHSLDIATSVKDEFGSGDAMESRGDDFHSTVNAKFKEYSNVLSAAYDKCSTRSLKSINVDEYDGKPLALSTYIFDIINRRAAKKSVL